MGRRKIKIERIKEDRLRHVNILFLFLGNAPKKEERAHEKSNGAVFVDRCQSHAHNF